jgi:hypothetical protein
VGRIWSTKVNKRRKGRSRRKLEMGWVGEDRRSRRKEELLRNTGEDRREKA